MLKIEALNENRVVTITASGKLTKKDYDQLLPELEKLLHSLESLRCYIKLDDFTGFDLDALWEDIKFDQKHMDQYGKTAIVGDKKWEEWGTKFSALFFKSELKFFYKNHSDNAWEWVNS